MSSVFQKAKHISYIQKIANDKSSFEYYATQHFRMSGVYWALTALWIVGTPLAEVINVEEIVQWVLSCQHENGGFGGDIGHDPHILYTLSAIQVLILCNALEKVDKAKIISFISLLQQPDGSFFGDKWGEIDTRFSYCSLSSLALLGALSNKHVNIDGAAAFIARCKNFDGGFGAVPDAESHAAQIFCCIGALSIINRLDYVDLDLLGWWLSERQCDSGGLNGRPEKQADVCYSWWNLSSMCMLGRDDWIDKTKLVDFILECQDIDDGGIAERPGNMADIFHTYFGIAGLSLLQYFDGKVQKFEDISYVVNNIDPTFALPEVLLKNLGVVSAKIPSPVLLS